MNNEVASRFCYRKRKFMTQQAQKPTKARQWQTSGRHGQNNGKTNITATIVPMMGQARHRTTQGQFCILEKHFAGGYVRRVAVFL